MSYTIGIIRPHHPDAAKDDEVQLQLTSFAGPGKDHKWLQLTLGTQFIRLSPGYILALMVLCEQRLKGEDSPMIEL